MSRSSTGAAAAPAPAAPAATPAVATLPAGLAGVNTANLAAILAGIGSGGAGGAGGGRAGMAQGLARGAREGGRAGMAQAQKPNQPSLSDVLEPRVLIPALEESPEGQKPNQPSLSDVLEPRVLVPALEESPEIPALEESPELAAALLEHLPQGDQSVQGLREVLRSPQLAQAVGQLDHVLQSGQGRELTPSFGLGFSMGSQGPAWLSRTGTRGQEPAARTRSGPGTESR
ncbi:hypothetical protein T484DRAFT_1910252 [Baffinella frigidus]|nr:hypothetical protein T484DRAFT_1910252 [Cryptophyta sp. CCMP2293]